MLWFRLKAFTRRLFRRNVVEQDLNDEIDAYLQADIDARTIRGLTPEEARRTALVELGGNDQLKEQVRDSRTAAWMDGVLADIRYAIRIAVRRPGFTLLAVLTMALGIGSSVAAYGVVDAVLLRPLPYRNSERLVSILTTIPKFRSDPVMGKIWDQWGLSYDQYDELSKRQTHFEAMSIYRSYGATLLSRDEGQKIRVGAVPAAFFPLLGVNANLGRLFLAEDEDPQTDQTAVLSYGMWERQFGRDPGVLGQKVTIESGNGPAEFTVIGVLSPKFDLPDSGMDSSPTPDLWVPLKPASAGFDRSDYGYSGLGILKPGVSAASAEAEAAPIMSARMPQSLPSAFFGSEGAHVVSLLRAQTTTVRNSLLILMGATVLLLLIACSNVANLLLGNAATRRHEIALRAAVGAGRLRIIRQLVTESVLLSTLGGVLGMTLAFWAMRVLVRLAPVDLPRANQIGVDPRVLLVAIGVSVLTGVLFGIVPAAVAVRGDLNEELKATVRTGTAHGRLQGLVMISEISLSFVLLIAAGLLTQSLFRIVAARPAIRPEHLLSVQADFSSPRYKLQPAVDTFTNETLARLRSLPGVDAVTAAEYAPCGGGSLTTVQIEGAGSGQAASDIILSARSVFPNYFSVLGTPIIAGRPFTDAENSDEAPVVMINKAMAQKFWSVDTALDKRIQVRDRWYSIVGIVADLRELSFEVTTDLLPTFYLADIRGQYSGWRRNTTFLIRSAIDPAVLTPLVRHQIAAVDKDMPLDNIQTVESLIQKSIAPDRYRTMLINIFAIMAASLALIGLYGVVSRTVVQRTRELSIRMALGAKPGNVLWMVLRQSLQLTAIGIGIGVLGAVALTRTLSGFLFAIRSTDVATYIGVAIGLLLVSLLSTYLPARRAAKTDPMIALRTV